MKNNNKLKYEILACYCAEYDKTMHFLIFKDNGEKFQAPNVLVDYGVKFHKLYPKYEMPSYTDLEYDTKRNKTYMLLVSKGNPYGLVENNKNVKINLN